MYALVCVAASSWAYSRGEIPPPPPYHGPDGELGGWLANGPIFGFDGGHGPGGGWGGGWYEGGEQQGGWTGWGNGARNPGGYTGSGGFGENNGGHLWGLTDTVEDDPGYYDPKCWIRIGLSTMNDYPILLLNST